MVEVIIDDEGRLGIKGPHIGYDLQGYRLTDEKGVLWTNDFGVALENGYLRVVGRRDDIAVLENGEKVPLLPIEERVMKLPFVREAVVFLSDGELTVGYAVDSVEHEVVSKWIEEIEIDAAVLEVANKGLPSYVTVSRAVWIPELQVGPGLADAYVTQRGYVAALVGA
jgi:long-chain acyl-CoA synthetase